MFVKSMLKTRANCEWREGLQGLVRMNEEGLTWTYLGCLGVMASVKEKIKAL